MTRREAVRRAEQELGAAGIAEAKLDARYLLYYVAKINSVEFLLYGEEEVMETVLQAYDELVKERAKRVPLQYLTGVQEFMGLEFSVTPDVLIPRQDTECLVEEALKHCKGKHVLDVCTGSGCIIISMARLGALASASACDISKRALDIAKANAKSLREEVAFYCGDLFAPVPGTYDVIVSNPPYIRASELSRLMPEVQNYEPRLALDGKEDGLEFYRRIAAEAGNYLNEGGMLFFEIGSEQAEEVMEIMRQSGFLRIRKKKDYAGLDRVVFGHWEGRK